MVRIGIQASLGIPDFAENLKQLIGGVRSNGHHYLIIDGLDDIMTSREVQFKSLAALIFEVQRLNKLLSDREVPAEIILLCRTDLFERIPGTNKFPCPGSTGSLNVLADHLAFG